MDRTSRPSPVDPRVVWFSRTYGYRGDLMYFRPLLAGVAAELPGTVVPVDRDAPVDRYPDVPLRPVVRSWSLPLPGRRGEDARRIPVPRPASVLRLWRTRPDVAVCLEFTPAALLGMAVARLRRGRVLLLVENDPRFRGAPATGVALAVKRRAAILATTVLTSNQEGARYVVEDLGVPADRVRVGAYLTSAPPGGPSPAPPVEDVVRLLFLNSVNDRKGILPLVRALADLGPAVRRWQLDVVGSGPLVEQVARTAAELGIGDAVNLHGAVDYADIWAHYRACHVVLCPSDGDYRSLAGFEAVTSGRPALLSVHDGAAAELARSGAAVLLVDPRTEDGLRDALRDLLGAPGRVEELLARAAVPPAGWTAADTVATVVEAVRATAAGTPAPVAVRPTHDVRRIVHVYLRPASFSTGGANRAAQTWAAGMATTTGLPTHYLQAADGFHEELVAAPGLVFETLSVVGRRRTTMVPRGLGQRLRAGDLVYLHEGWTPSNLAVAALCRRRGIPYVVMPHGVYERSIVEPLRTPFPRSQLERWALHGAAAVHLFFASEEEHLADVAPRARSVVAPTGVTVSTVPASVHRQPYTAWLARYDIRHKGIDILLAAMARLPRADRPRLRMAGQDHLGDRERVRALVDRLGLADEVTVGDELAHDEAQEFLARAAAFVHTPRWESLGIAVLEALSCGTRTVLTDTAHVAAVLGEHGLVEVVPLDEEAVAAALRTTAAVEADAPAASARRRDGLHRVMGWPTVLEQWRAGMAAAGLALPRADRAADGSVGGVSEEETSW